MHIRASRFATLWILLLCMLSMIGCVGEHSDDSAVSPSNSYSMSQAELDRVLKQAQQGDVNAMSRLVDYYLINQEDGDVQGWYWLERLGDTGDMQSRKSVLGIYQNHPDAKVRARGEALRKKWSVQSQNKSG